MIGIFVTVCILGVGLTQGCVTEADKTAVNDAVTALSTSLGPIALDPALNQSRKMFTLLNTTCYDTPTREKADIIDGKLRACPALVNDTSVSSLSFVGLEFGSLFTEFSSMDAFCSCFPALLQASGIGQVAANLFLPVSDGQYDMVVNTHTLCMQTPFNMQEAIVVVAKKVRMCPALLTYLNSTRLNQVLLYKMTGFILGMNCELNYNSTCALAASSSTLFKHCMRPSDILKDENSEDKWKKPGCRRSVCIDDNITKDCNATSAHVYKWSVVMYGHKEDVTLGDCSGARVTVASLLVIAVTSLLTSLI